MNIQPYQRPTFSARAAQLLQALPQAGPAAQRRQAADQAVDTLVREYSLGATPEVALGRLAGAMGRATGNDSIAETAFRTGLSAAAAGTPVSGISLASMAVSILNQTPGSEREPVLEAAYQMLVKREDLKPTLGMVSTLTSGALLGDLLPSTRKQQGWAQGVLLSAAADGVSPGKAAGTLLTGLGPTQYAGRVAKEMVEKLAQESSGEVAVTYNLAESVMGEWWNSDNYDRRQIGISFLSDLPHSASGQATRLRQADIRDETRRAGLTQLASQLKTDGNESWKYLELAASLRVASGPARGAAGIPNQALSLALGQVSDQPGAVGATKLCTFMSEVGNLYGEVSGGRCAIPYVGVDCYLSVQDQLKSLLPTPGWQTAVDLISATASIKEGFTWNAGYAFSKLGRLSPEQSPVLSVCQVLAQSVLPRGLSVPQLEEALALAQSRVTDAHEIATLRQAQALLASKGPEAVSDYLEGNLSP